VETKTPKINQRWNTYGFKTMRAYYRTLTEAKLFQKMMFYNHVFCNNRIQNQMEWNVRNAIIPEFSVITNPMCIDAHAKLLKLEPHKHLKRFDMCKYCLFNKKAGCEEETYVAMRSAKTIKELHAAILARIDFLTEIEERARIKIGFDRAVK